MCISVNSWIFIVYSELQSNTIFLILLLRCSAMAIGSCFRWLLHPFDTPHYCAFCLLVCFWEIPYFLALQGAPSSSFYIQSVMVQPFIWGALAPLLESGLGSRDLGARWIHCSQAVVASWPSQLAWQGNACMCFNSCIYIFYVFL